MKTHTHSIKTLTDTLKALDFPLFKGDWNLNIIGIRSADRDANTFNDTLCVLFQVHGRWHVYQFDMTTDPGVFYRENPINVDGVGWLVPGHHAGLWSIGVFKGKYKALMQTGPATVYRDNDRDALLDNESHIDTGYFGCCLHRAHLEHKSIQVDKWSAMCQVLADPLDFDVLMALVHKSASIYGNSFSYTLLTEEQMQ